MSEIGAITKDKVNTQQGFKYRGVDDVMNALQPLLIKYKVFIVPEIVEHAREERTSKQGSNLIYSICKIKYTFFAEDGSNFTSVVVGEGMDSGDKATNKAMAIAFKYVCFQVFCIPTEEMVDPDHDAHETLPVSKIPLPNGNDFELPEIFKNHTCADCGNVVTSTAKRSIEQIVENSQKYYHVDLCALCASIRYKKDHPNA
jgi:hypothetical protein